MNKQQKENRQMSKEMGKNTEKTQDTVKMVMPELIKKSCFWKR